MQPEPPPSSPYGDLLPASPYGDLLPPAPRRRTWLPVASAGAVLAVVAAVLVLVLGGSHGSQGSRGSHGSSSAVDAAAVVHGVDARAQQAGSSSVDMTTTMTMQGETITGNGSGAFDYRRHVGRMTLTMDHIGNMQEVVTPQAIYIRLPDGLGGALGSSARPWLELRLSAFKKSGVDLSKLMNSGGGSDPGAMLKMLAAATAIQRDGTGQVRGVTTTRYSGVTTMMGLIRAEGVTGAIDLSKLPPGVADSTVHMSVWVDSSGMARRMSMHLDMALYGSMDMTIDLYGFGRKVTVVVPPQSIVTDISNEVTTRVGG